MTNPYEGVYSKRAYLTDDGTQVRELGEVFECGHPLGTDDLVDLALSLRLYLWMRHKQEDKRL